jgi:hypothetical protein
VAWLRSAWRGEQSGLQVLVLLVLVPWGINTFIGSRLGFFSLFNIGFHMPLISIPFGLLEFAFAIYGIISYWRCSFNGAPRWAGYAGRIIVAIRTIDIGKRIFVGILFFLFLLGKIVL